MKRTSTCAPALAKPALKLAPVVKLRLQPKTIYTDCVDDLRDMLVEARKGEIIGYAIAVMYKEGDYTVKAMGEAEKSPTYVLGMVALLKNYFLRKVLDK